MREVRKLAGTLFLSEQEEIENAIRRVFSIYYTVKEDGLLASEQFVGTGEEYIGKWFLEKAIMNLCDGMVPGKLDALMTNRILAETDSKKQFLCLLYKSGIEQIAKDEPICYLKQYISSLFPEACAEQVWDYMEQIMDQHNEQVFEKKQKQVPEIFQATRMELPFDVMRRFHGFKKEFLEMDDVQIQEILKDTENFHVCSLLLAGTDAFRERILENMSKRLRIMMMEDVVERGIALNENYEQEVENVKTALAVIGK